MATVSQQWEAIDADIRSTTFPQISKVDGTNLPVSGYKFDAATEQAVFIQFRAVRYGSGNVTVDLDWYADTASTNVCIWGAALAAITPNTDTQDVETDALATAATTNTTHLGTTGQRLHRTTVTVSSLDSLAADDDVSMRLYRDADAAGDTMAGGAILTRVTVSYSDT